MFTPDAKMHVPVGMGRGDPARVVGGPQQGKHGTPGSAHMATSAKVNAQQHVIPGSGHFGSHTKVDSGHHVIPGSGHFGAAAQPPSHAHLRQPTKVDAGHHVLVGQQHHPAPLTGIQVPQVFSHPHVSHYPQVVHVPPPETYLSPVPVFVPSPVNVVHTPVYTHIDTDNVSSGGSGLIAGGVITLIIGVALAILGTILLSTGNFPWGITVTALGALAIGGGIAMLYYGSNWQEA